MSVAEVPLPFRQLAVGWAAEKRVLGRQDAGEISAMIATTQWLIYLLLTPKARQRGELATVAAAMIPALTIAWWWTLSPLNENSFSGDSADSPGETLATVGRGLKDHCVLAPQNHSGE